MLSLYITLWFAQGMSNRYRPRLDQKSITFAEHEEHSPRRGPGALRLGLLHGECAMLAVDGACESNQWISLGQKRYEGNISPVAFCLCSLPPLASIRGHPGHGAFTS